MKSYANAISPWFVDADQNLPSLGTIKYFNLFILQF
jgi:hypothetical protein